MSTDAIVTICVVGANLLLSLYKLWFPNKKNNKIIEKLEQSVSKVSSSVDELHETIKKNGGK
jgi:hypothetical protein